MVISASRSYEAHERPRAFSNDGSGDENAAATVENCCSARSCCHLSTDKPLKQQPQRKKLLGGSSRSKHILLPTHEDKKTSGPALPF